MQQKKVMKIFQIGIGINSEKRTKRFYRVYKLSIIPKPQTPKHKAEVKKAYDQRIEDGFYLENLLVGGNPLEEMADYSSLGRLVVAYT